MKHSKIWPVTLAGVIGLLISSLIVPVRTTFAHPLDQFVLASYLTVTPQAITVEVNMTPGVLLAPQFLTTLDTNNDQQVSDAEAQTYAQTVLKQLELKVDDKPLQLTLIKIEMPSYLNLQTGYGEMRLYTQAALSGEATTRGITHQVFFKNNYQPANPAYQVTAFLDDTVPVTVGPQKRDDIQQSVNMSFTIAITGSATQTNTNSAVQSTPGMTNSSSVAQEYTASNPQQLQQVFDFLNLPELSFWVLLGTLGLAVLLGGLHALTPGHGKTMVAAYLVGSRGTARHAIALGGIVTFTHTISVIGIGLVALLASQFIVPTVLVPVLESIAGVLVISLGLRLIWTRWGWLKGKPAASINHTHTHETHSHLHDHDHNHEHDNLHLHSHSQDSSLSGSDHSHTDDYIHIHDDKASSSTHTHGTHSHTHGPLPEKIRAGDLIAMGISGGLVPCPEALGILVVAVGINRIGLGLGLILAFSLGIAIVLITIGLLLVRARTLLDRLSNRGKSWQRWLPLVSAGIVTIIGVAMVFNGLKNYPLVLAIGTLVAVLTLGGIWICLRLVRTNDPTAATYPTDPEKPNTQPLGSSGTSHARIANSGLGERQN